AQVFTTRTSALAASFVSSCPACCASPSITSESTRFLGQPRLNRPIFISTRSTTMDTRDTKARPVFFFVSLVSFVVHMAVLWIQPVEHTWIRNRFADVFELADPGDDALDAHAETAVRNGAVPAEVEVPLERLLRQVVLLDAG